MAETVYIKAPFLWEGTDRKGQKIKGKAMAADEATVRADLRRQGVVPTRIRKQRKSMPEFAVWAYSSAHDALAMAELSPDDIENDQTGLIYGCDSSCVAAIEQVDALRDKGETSVGYCVMKVGSRRFSSPVASNISICNLPAP